MDSVWLSPPPPIHTHLHTWFGFCEVAPVMSNVYAVELVCEGGGILL